jgi:hypothetical protein
MVTHAHNGTGFGRDGGASAASRAAVRAWRIAGGGGEGVGSDPGQCPPLVPRVERPGMRGAQGRGPRGPEAQVGRRAAGRGGTRPAVWSAGAWIQHRPLDPAAGRRSDRAADTGPPPSRPCLATAAPAGLVTAAADAACARTRRPGDRDLEDAALAAAKKTPGAGWPGASSRTRAVSRNSPSSAAPGRRGGKRPS